MGSYSEMSKYAVKNEEEEEEDTNLRRGPWTVEEDRLLVSYISTHGEGQWNALARSAGLKRTGKSCRLRWLNYLRPEVRRGNITPEEQLLILELHSRWGNRWSKIAQHLPGRTDNEIKNYWRTRVQKHAKHMQCDVNSQQFRDTMRYLWMPRLMERIQAARSTDILQREASDFTTQTSSNQTSSSSPESSSIHDGLRQTIWPEFQMNHQAICESSYITTPSDSASGVSDSADYYCLPEFPPVTDLTQAGCSDYNQGSSYEYVNQGCTYPDLLLQSEMNSWNTSNYGGDFGENLWSSEDVWFLQQQLCNTTNHQPSNSLRIA